MLELCYLHGFMCYDQNIIDLKWCFSLGVQGGSIVCHELWMFDFYFFLLAKNEIKNEPCQINWVDFTSDSSH